jgi:hypothetical protein
MQVEYSWLLNGTVIKEGRKSFLVYVTQPGTYQCVVKVNNKEEKTDPVEIVNKVKEQTSGREKNMYENTGI